MSTRLGRLDTPTARVSGSGSAFFGYLGRVDREPDRERRSLVHSRTGGHDLALMLTDDPVRDREPQTGSLPFPALGKEGLENVLEDIGLHATAIVGEEHLSHALAVARVDLQGSMGFHGLQRIDDEIQHNLLDLLAVHVRQDGLADEK